MINTGFAWDNFAILSRLSQNKLQVVFNSYKCKIVRGRDTSSHIITKSIAVKVETLGFSQSHGK